MLEIVFTHEASTEINQISCIYETSKVSRTDYVERMTFEHKKNHN